MLQTIVGLTSKTRTPPEFFCLDLNCAIYHCVKKLQKSQPYNEDSRYEWEEKLIQYVIAYIKLMKDKVNPSKVLYVAVDGVVPMAKIKQQRMRRFKSAREAETIRRITAEAKGIPYVEESRWDTTAITPGTQFMTKLSSALRAFQASSPRTIMVSPADEPGEGEQKIMAFLRLQKATSSVVYGLDADLIVLSLLNSKLLNMEIDLFREEVEFNGSIKMDVFDSEQFLFMNIGYLAKVLYSKYSKPNTSESQFIYDFVGLMSLLGNDFVPHSLSLKIREDGIQKLMEFYKNTYGTLVESDTWTYNMSTLRSLYQNIQAKESEMVLSSIKHKLEYRVGNTGSRDVVEQALTRYNDTPILWAAEKVLVNYVKSDTSPLLQLVNNWKEVYNKEVFGDSDIKYSTKIFLQIVGWTLKYYVGQIIDNWFYYPWFLPPLAEDVVHYLSEDTFITPQTIRPNLSATDQLAIVLPQESYHLLPTRYQFIPKTYFYAFPLQWDFHSFGRRYMWECEPLIPLILPEQIQTWMIGKN